MTRLSRRPALAFVAGALIVAAVVGGRAAYAALTDDVITACFKPSNGTLYLVGNGSSRTDCQPGDQPISWNAQGPAGSPGQPGPPGAPGEDGEDGEDGISVTSVALAPGADPNCPLGGSRFTSASGVTYACNGGFAAESRSPNGAFRIRLDDAGIALEGPVGRINVTNSGVVVDAATTLRLRGAVVDFDALSNLDVDAGGPLTLDAPLIFLNGSACGFLRPPDVAPFVPFGGGPVLINPAGSPTVRTGC
jgi:hypothetical protein